MVDEDGAGVLLLAVVLLFGSAWVLHASPTSLALPWWTVDGGGGESSGGDAYAVAGTIGQPDAGPALTGGDYTLVEGFSSGAGPEGHPTYLPLVLRNLP